MYLHSNLLINTNITVNTFSRVLLYKREGHYTRSAGKPSYIILICCVCQCKNVLSHGSTVYRNGMIAGQIH